MCKCNCSFSVKDFYCYLFTLVYFNVFFDLMFTGLGERVGSFFLGGFVVFFPQQVVVRGGICCEEQKLNIFVLLTTLVLGGSRLETACQWRPH